VVQNSAAARVTSILLLMQVDWRTRSHRCCYCAQSISFPIFISVPRIYTATVRRGQAFVKLHRVDDV